MNLKESILKNLEIHTKKGGWLFKKSNGMPIQILWMKLNYPDKYDFRTAIEELSQEGVLHNLFDIHAAKISKAMNAISTTNKSNNRDIIDKIMKEDLSEDEKFAYSWAYLTNEED